MDNQPSSSATRLYEDGTTSHEKELDTYYQLLMACHERVQMIHAPTFNKKQCQYLVDKLKEVVGSSSSFIRTSQGATLVSWAPPKSEKNLLTFKLLMVLGTQIERFVQGCSQKAWLLAAMTLTNMLEFVASMGFHLELCQVALSQKSEVSGDLTLNQVVDISKDVNDIVKAKASLDKKVLLEKISLALPSLYGDEKDLASYLLQRLLRVAPTPSTPSPESKWDLSQYLAFWRSISKKVKEEVTLGRGASATVLKARWLGMEVAIKVFLGKNNLEFDKEVDILAGLCHFNITSMFCCTQERQECSIFMELMDGDLLRLIQQRLKVNPDSSPFNIWEAIDLMHQIAEGGRYLHNQGIVHRDLKSMNILVKSVKTPSMDLECIHAKVADFNISKIKKNSTTNTALTPNVGSSRWMAPELIDLHKTSNQMSVGTSYQPISRHPRKCDIYSYAMVCFEILTGELPFGDVNNPKTMKEMILQGDRPKLPTDCPSKLRVLIEKCWNPEPKSRPTFDDICQELKYVKYVLLTDTSSTSKTFEEVKRMKRKYGDVLEDINKSNDLELNDVAAVRTFGRGIEEMMGHYANALKGLNKDDEPIPNDVKTLKTRGDVKQLMGKSIDALEDVNKANEHESDDVVALGIRGGVGMNDHYADALEDLNMVHELLPNDVETLKSRVEIKRLMGRYGEALEDLNKADELEPNNAVTLKNRAEVNRWMCKYADALEDINKANELEPNDALTLQRRGTIIGIMGKHADALEDLNKANELKPNDVVTLGIRGGVKGIMGQYASALEDWNKANELLPNKALTLKSRAKVKQLMGKYADALEDLNKANELEPNDIVTLQNRGAVKGSMKKYIGALEDLNKALELDPNDVETLKIRGGVKKAMGLFASALEDLNKAHELDPNDVVKLKIRAGVMQMMGKYADALKDLNKANELKPNDVETLLSRGIINGLMNKFVDALQDLNRAHELEPNDVLTLRARVEVKKMMGQSSRS